MASTDSPDITSQDLAQRITIDRHRAGQEDDSFREELREAFTGSPRRLPSKYFYDDHGSELFERICELPEYYPTRTERAILEAHADEIVAASGAQELVELGSGAATKTEVLLDAMERAGCLDLYVPVDVSEVMVEGVAERFAHRYPSLEIHGLVADFMGHLGRIPEGGRRLAIFLGSTIGNLPRDDARQFLSQVASSLAPGDHLLLGTDLIKDRETLEAAYNDSQGVTAAFNLNILTVVNDLTGSDFDPQGFRHRAFFNGPDHRIEMRLVSLRPQTVTFPQLDLTAELAEGEEILTEISTKFDRPKVESLLGDSGFELVRWFTDPKERFALSLARRV